MVPLSPLPGLVGEAGPARPFTHQAPSGLPCPSYISPSCRPCPPPNFLGKRPSGGGGGGEESWGETGAWSPVLATPRDCWGPARRVWEPERPPRAPTLPAGVLSWKKGPFAGPGTPAPQPGQPSQGSQLSPPVPAGGHRPDPVLIKGRLLVPHLPIRSLWHSWVVLPHGSLPLDFPFCTKWGWPLARERGNARVARRVHGGSQHRSYSWGLGPAKPLLNPACGDLCVDKPSPGPSLTSGDCLACRGPAPVPPQEASGLPSPGFGALGTGGSRAGSGPEPGGGWTFWSLGSPVSGLAVPVAILLPSLPLSSPVTWEPGLWEAGLASTAWHSALSSRHLQGRPSRVSAVSWALDQWCAMQPRAGSALQTGWPFLAGRAWQRPSGSSRWQGFLPSGPGQGKARLSGSMSLPRSLPRGQLKLPTPTPTPGPGLLPPCPKAGGFPWRGLGVLRSRWSGTPQCPWQPWSASTCGRVGRGEALG